MRTRFPVFMRVVAVWAVLLALALAAAVTASPTPNPDRLVILSTTDLKGKASPCGCHTPKGGFARRAGFTDSLAAEYGQILSVDAGGFFPELEGHEAVATFMMSTLKLIGADAVGIGDRDLRFGRAFLLANQKATGLTLVCSNLLDRKSKKPVLAPTLIQKVGSVTVGVFAVMSDKVDLGPSRDSLIVVDPIVAARRAIADLRKQGATVVVMLSQLGKVETEDLGAAVDGFDAVIVGRNAPNLPNGRKLKQAIYTYGGEQGHFLGVTKFELDAARRPLSSESEMFMLGPDVAEKPAVLALVKSFEDRFNEEQKRIQKEKNDKAREAALPADPNRFLGAEMCRRCHEPEYTQWQSTSHARAWQTLVDQHKDATPDCVPCHVTGYQKPGGFQSAEDAPKLGNVQCENCHGMGTAHEARREKTAEVTEATCRGCHNETTSPAFQFALFRPHVLHTTPADLPPLPPKPASTMMKSTH